MGFYSRGIEQIRTAVQAFAELCLATRPRCLIQEANVVLFIILINLY